MFTVANFKPEIAIVQIDEEKEKEKKEKNSKEKKKGKSLDYNFEEIVIYDSDVELLSKETPALPIHITIDDDS